jgi:hypothetical protein
METLIRHIHNNATWHKSIDSKGRWLGIDATKSNGKSPILIKVLTKLEGLAPIHLSSTEREISIQIGRQSFLISRDKPQIDYEDTESNNSEEAGGDE